MKKQKNHLPPAWAGRFLEFYCRPELLEDLQGDLNEYFDRHAREKGLRRAKVIYIVDVFKFFRSYTIRKPHFLNLFIQWIMIGSYIKTSGRSIARNKLFSTINIVGLAISMSVGLLMISFLNDLTSYDDFHANKKRIYRVVSSHKNMDEESNGFASTSVKAGKSIKETIPGIEEITLMRKSFSGDARVGDKIIPIEAPWADESFFKVFSFPLLKGDPATALKAPYSIVLTELTAKKLFGDGEALGKTIAFDTLNYVVTGIARNVPKFSHIQFEALVSFTTTELQQKNDKQFLKWESIWSNYTYLVVPESTDLQTLQSNLDRLSATENKSLEHTKIGLSLQPLKQIALGEDFSNPIGPVMTISVVWIVGGLTLVVILSACFNYTNLSIARSLRRSKEVGIRKVIGALNTHVLTQFICEAILISVMALAFSFILFLLLRPQFLSIAPELQNMVSLELSLPLTLYFVGFALVTGFLAGLLPALFFSRINAISVLKDASSLRVFGNMSMRKTLIVVQYTLSLIFIAATVIGYKQYKNFLAFDLGFVTENILNIRLQGNKGDLLIKELKEIPEVGACSRSLMITSIGNYWGSQMKYNNPLDSSDIWYNYMDENYLPLHGHKLLAGRNFLAKAEKAEETEVIVNEQVIKRFNIGANDPSKALGEVVTVDGKKLTIVGVLKDFHYGKVDHKIEPVVFRYSPSGGDGFVNVKVLTTDWPATLARIETAWLKLDKVHKLEATFYDDQIERSYNEYAVMIKIVGFLGFLAICIASIGLLGMVIFTTETRLKEISIRKVLGANEGNLIYLMSKGFLILLAISAAIALPVTYYFFELVVLSGFAYHAPISIADLLVGVFAVMTVALIMIGSQTIKVAKSNPAQVLKNE